MKIEVSNGEIIDKYTILNIKLTMMSGSALRNVIHEHELLVPLVNNLIHDYDIKHHISELQLVNKMLWDVEDNLRNKHRDSEFDADFIALATQVYTLNDRRAAIKRCINIQTSSSIIEEKLYNDYVSSDVQ